jgi:hypothetical protein
VERTGASTWEYTKHPEQGNRAYWYGADHGKDQRQGVGEVLAVPSTSRGAEKGREVMKIFLEKSSWVDQVKMTDEVCALEFVKKQHKKVDLIHPYIQD